MTPDHNKSGMGWHLTTPKAAYINWCILNSSIKISENFLILRKLNEIWWKVYIGLHVKYRLLFLYRNVIFIFVTEFFRIEHYQISWKSIGRYRFVHGAEGRADRRTTKYDEVKSNFSNVSVRKEYQFCHGSSIGTTLPGLFGKPKWVEPELEGDVSAAPFGDGCKKGIRGAKDR